MQLHGTTEDFYRNFRLGRVDFEQTDHRGRSHLVPRVIAAFVCDHLTHLNQKCPRIP